ncbi:hypothetical protein ACJU26_09825 [Acidithiobacillus sp. M4-SHS-6]|uniref:hypothetical protein n=1 Tax=Acidithiobacillus sp. M4-SHS-6 TaxID=3383024 RepID=UPI0039BE196A
MDTTLLDEVKDLEAHPEKISFFGTSAELDAHLESSIDGMILAHDHAIQKLVQVMETLLMYIRRGDKKRLLSAHRTLFGRTTDLQMVGIEVSAYQTHVREIVAWGNRESLKLIDFLESLRDAVERLNQYVRHLDASLDTGHRLLPEFSDVEAKQSFESRLHTLFLLRTSMEQTAQQYRLLDGKIVTQLREWRELVTRVIPLWVQKQESIRLDESLEQFCKALNLFNQISEQAQGV